MITKLKLTNFQTHRKLDLDIGELTTIVGTTDTGKSSVLRALRWALRNDLRGSGFVMWGEDQATAVVELDGKKITRQRKKAGNVYKLNEQEFKAFGNNVPDTLQKFVNVSDINFQAQHDAPFWLSLSDAEVSKRLNELVDLTLIDQAAKNAAGKLRDARYEYRKLQDREQELKTSIAGRRPLAALHKQLKEVEQQQLELDEQISEISHLQLLITSIQGAEQSMGAVPDIAPVVELYSELEDKQTELEQLSKHITQIQDAATDLAHWQEEAKQLHGKLHKDTKGKTCPLCGNLM